MNIVICQWDAAHIKLHTIQQAIIFVCFFCSQVSARSSGAVQFIVLLHNLLVFHEHLCDHGDVLSEGILGLLMLFG